jgi:hypothetical protein
MLTIKKMKTLGAGLAMVAFLFMPDVVRAGDLADFNKAVASAYAHYRSAAFYLRTGNPSVASLELEDMAEKWGALEKRFAAAPPDAFVDDPAWRETITDIRTRIDAAITAAITGDATAGQAALAPVRGALADLRSRNGVRVFSDCIDEANAAATTIWVFRHNPPDFDNHEQLDQLRANTALVTYLYERCRDQAPTAIRDNATFKRIMTGALHSMSRMWVAINDRNRTAVVNILREFRSFDKLLYLEFG